MSIKSYFRKKHKYETQADLKDLTAEQIVSLNPAYIGFYIEDETGGIPLTGVKKRALFNLLSQKREEKTSGPNPKAREKIIDSFLKRENLRNDPDVNKLIVQANTEVMGDKVKTKEMENRLRRLEDKSEMPYTEEEKLHLRLSKLNTNGGKTKRNRRRKTKKRKSLKKRQTHKKK